MADKKVTCRYCDSEDVNSMPTPAGPVPLCERHAKELGGRVLTDIDRIMGQPVHNPDLVRSAQTEPQKEF